MKKTISERIKEGLKIRNMKQTDLVAKTGIGKSSYFLFLNLLLFFLIWFSS